jgi:hypothetical protein
MTFDGLSEPLQEFLSIRVEQKNRSPIATSRGDVVDPAGDKYAEWSGHAIHPRANSIFGDAQ